LIVLGSDVTALAVVRRAAALGVTPVVVDTHRGIAAASRLARAEIRAASPPQLLPRVRALAEGSPTAVLATSDVWLRVLLEHRSELEAVCLDVLHPRNASLEICLDKRRFARWCTETGLPTPRSYGLSLDSVPAPVELEDVVFPVLVRPAQTLHSRPAAEAPKAVEVRCPQELARCLERFRCADVAPMISESLLGRHLQQFSVGLARAGDRSMTVVMQKHRPRPDACGVGSFVEVTEQADVEQLALRAASALDYRGIAEIEVLRDEVSGETFLIEVNARPWLQFGLAAATGRDLLRFVVDAAAPSERASNRRRMAVWLDFRNDLRVCFGPQGLVRRGRVRFRDYLLSIARANVFARWSLGDPLPFCIDTCALVRALVSRTRRANRD
jgi:predicted ATP-grasp superfamily ATP-dependent carboligase